MSILKVDQIFTTDDTPLFTTSSSKTWNATSYSMPDEISSGTMVQIQEHMYYGSNSHLYVTDTTPIPFAITPPDLMSVLTGSNVIIHVSFQIQTSASSNYLQTSNNYSTYGGIVYINSTSAPKGTYVNGTMHEQTNDIPPFDESEIVHKEIVRFQEDSGNVFYNLPMRIQAIDTPKSNFPVYTGYISRDSQIESLRSTGSFGIVLRWGIKFVLMEMQA